jgi:SAM-dependent methyltransferase
MTDFWENNCALWDELTGIHAQSAFYALDAFRAGGSSLRPVEVEELGDVSGKSLLHLQCHFGLDTLSLARRGVRVTGADFSPRAIDLARSLSIEMGLPAHFVCSRIEDLPNVLPGMFDIVFTSYGVLCWLADLRRWAEVIAHFLKPGGVFYIVELHPLADTLADDAVAANLRIAYPYFHSAEPMACPTNDGSYADRTQRVSQAVSYQWSHSLGDIINALIGVGLRIEYLHEFPFCPYDRFPGMERGADGWWRFPDPAPSLPQLFSLRASRSA